MLLSSEWFRESGVEGALLELALLLLCAAGGAALWRMSRTGETRWAPVAGTFGALAGLAILSSAPPWWPEMGLAAVHRAAPLLVLVASGFALAAGIGFGRTVRERDRAETAHWERMESVRALGQLAETGAATDARDELARLLAIGRDSFGLEIGAVSRIVGDRFELIEVRAPADWHLRRGNLLDLDETFCEHTLASGRPLSVSCCDDSPFADHPARNRLALEAYLGTVIRTRAGSFGTLFFGSREASRRPLSATDKDLLTLLASWAGVCLDRAIADVQIAQVLPPLSAPGRTASAVTAAEPPEPQDPAPVPSPHPNTAATRTRRRKAEDPDQRVLFDLLTARPAEESGHATDSATDAPPRDVAPPTPAPARQRLAAQGADPLEINSVVSRLRRGIELRSGGSANVSLELESDLPPIRPPSAPLRDLVLSVVDHSAADLPVATHVEIRTARVSAAPGSPHSAGFVTLSICRTALAEPEPAPETPSASARTGESSQALPLERVVHLLQSSGGDFAAEIEPSQHSTYTLFLPVAPPAPSADAPRAPQARAGA